MRYQLNLEKIGERVRELRTKKHLTQEGFGMKFGYGKNTISKIERGELNGLSVEFLVTLANYFDVDINYFLTGNKEINFQQISSSMPDRNKKNIKESLEYLLSFF